MWESEKFERVCCAAAFQIKEGLRNCAVFEEPRNECKLALEVRSSKLYTVYCILGIMYGNNACSEDALSQHLPNLIYHSSHLECCSSNFYLLRESITRLTCLHLRVLGTYKEKERKMKFLSLKFEISCTFKFKTSQITFFLRCLKNTRFLVTMSLIKLINKQRWCVPFND